MFQTHHQTQAHMHQQMPTSRPDPIATAFERTWQFIHWALHRQPLYHKGIDRRVASHQERANKASWQAVEATEMWDKRDAQRKAVPVPTTPVPPKAVSDPADLLIHTGLRQLLHETRLETETRKTLGDIPTDVLSPSPKEQEREGDTATRPAVRTQRWYTLSLSAGEDLLPTIDRHIAEYQRVLERSPQRLRVGDFFACHLALHDFAPMYTRGGADLPIVTDPTLRKNQIILE